MKKNWYDKTLELITRKNNKKFQIYKDLYNRNDVCDKMEKCIKKYLDKNLLSGKKLNLEKLKSEVKKELKKEFSKTLSGINISEEEKKRIKC